VSHAVGAAFTAFINSPVRDEYVLIEVNPRYVLSGFTATGGLYTNTYQISFSRFETANNAMPSGVYRKVTGVRENATDLTERTSISTVNSNAGSFWWDEANEVLYVHSSTGADPDTFSAYQALVRFYFATKPIILNLTDGDDSTGVYYHPWVIGTLPELIDRDNDQVFGTKITSGGDITFINTSGWWNAIIAQDGSYRWKNAKVSMFLGGNHGTTVMLRSEYEAMCSFLVEDLGTTDTDIIMSVHPLVKHLDATIPKTPYFESDYPNLGEGVRGTRKWIGYGRTTMRPDLTDDSGNGVYTIADAAYQTLYAVNAAYAVHKTTGVSTLLTVTTHYTVDLTACTLTIVDATYAWQNYFIHVDVTGKPDGAGSYLKTFPTVVQDLLTTFLGVRTADIDTDSFTDYDDTSEISLWVKESRTVASIMSTVESGVPCLESPVGGILFQTHEGQWHVDNWDPSYVLDDLNTFRRSDFASFKTDPDLSSVFSKVNVFYDYNHATGAWSVTTATNAAQGYLQDIDDELNVYTFLKDAASAQVVASRMLSTIAGKVLNVEIEEVGARLSTYQVREKLLVTYSPAPLVAGEFDQFPMEVVELRRSFDPTLKMTARLGSLRGIGEFIGRWTDSLAADYASAPESERVVNGYWSNSSGYVVPGDPTTLNISLWW